MEIGKKIQQLRREKNLTQEQAAAALGVTSAAVSKWETNAAMPDVALLCPLARLLGTTVDALLDFRPALEPEEINALLEDRRQLFEARRLEEAEKLYQTEVWSSGRDVSLNLVGLYNTACRRKDWSRAMEYLDAAMAVEEALHTEELGGLTGSLHMLRSEVLLHQGKMGEAMEGLTEYVDRSLAQWARINGGEEIRSGFYDRLEMRASGMSAAYLAKYIRAALEESEELAPLREREDFQVLLSRLAKAGE